MSVVRLLFVNVTSVAGGFLAPGGGRTGRKMAKHYRLNSAHRGTMYSRVKMDGSQSIRVNNTKICVSGGKCGIYMNAARAGVTSPPPRTTRGIYLYKNRTSARGSQSSTGMHSRDSAPKF